MPCGFRLQAEVSRLHTMTLLLLLALAFSQTSSPVRVVMETEAGEIEMEIDATRAPITAGNFLKYVDAGLYDGGRFHRTVTLKPDNQPDNTTKIEVIQAAANAARRQEFLPPIPLERTSATGIRHLDGALSMARSGPDSARDGFFICVGDQPSLDYGGTRNADGQGFAAFGRVVRGMDVVRKIHAARAEGQTLAPSIRILRVARR
jgi:peptidyl-prolyl cis-trans isomerase A (cyclophilin A)